MERTISDFAVVSCPKSGIPLPVSWFVRYPVSTWKQRHLAGAVVRRRIENELRARGFDAPEICTPEELMTDTQTDGSPNDS